MTFSKIRSSGSGKYELNTNNTLHTYTIQTNAGISREGSRVILNINQTTSNMKTSLADLYATRIKQGYRPKYAKLAPCTMFNTGDNRHYVGYLRISETGQFSAAALLSGGGLQSISTGSTYYIWALNMS